MMMGCYPGLLFDSLVVSPEKNNIILSSSYCILGRFQSCKLSQTTHSVGNGHLLPMTRLIPLHRAHVIDLCMTEENVVFSHIT